MYSEFCELCGFEPEEIKRESPRIGRAFNIWGITSDDVKRGEERIRRFYDLESVGMSKCRGIVLKDFIDLTLAKEEGKKVIYSSFPPVAQITGAMAILSEDVYCISPEPVILGVLGRFFGKLGPLLEQAEQSWLPPGQGHCPFLQARLASILGGMIAMPDLLTAIGVVCDQAGKTDDMIAYFKGVPVVHVDSCNDDTGEWWPYPDPRRVRYLALELRNVAEVFHQVTGLKLDEEAMNRVNKAYGELKSVLDEVQELRGRSDPVPISEKDWMNVAGSIGVCSRRGLIEGPDALRILQKELQERIKRGIGVLPKGAPRIFNVTPHTTDPLVSEVLENAGLAVVTQVGTPPSLALPSEYHSVWEQIADRSLRIGVQSSAAGTIEQMKDQCQEWDVDGLVIAAVIKCRINNIHPRKTKEVIEKELGIPVLAMEFCNLDSREYTAEQFKSRVEPFAEMLKDRKRKPIRGSK